MLRPTLLAALLTAAIPITALAQTAGLPRSLLN